MQAMSEELAQRKNRGPPSQAQCIQTARATLYLSCLYTRYTIRRFFQSSNLLNLFPKRRCVSKLLIAVQQRREQEREREREPPGIARARWHIYIYVQYIYRQTVAWRALTGENSWNYPRMQCNAMHAIPPRAIRRYIEHREQASPSLPANVSFRSLVSSRFVSFRFASFRATLRYTFARPCISSLLQSLYIYVSMGQPHSPPPHLPNLRAVCVCYVRICNM